MTGTDPAVDAAQRAWDDTDGFGFDTSLDAMEEAAREALAPIRNILVALGESIDALSRKNVAATFPLLACAVNDIEKHTFTSEELTND